MVQEVDKEIIAKGFYEDEKFYTSNKETWEKSLYKSDMEDLEICALETTNLHAWGKDKLFNKFCKYGGGKFISKNLSGRASIELHGERLKKNDEILYRQVSRQLRGRSLLSLTCTTIGHTFLAFSRTEIVFHFISQMEIRRDS